MGELHIYDDELYYHSSKEGGKGGTDIWMLTNIDGKWQNPVNVEAVNSEVDDGYPFITADGQEMWINRWYMGTPAVFRSKWADARGRHICRREKIAYSKFSCGGNSSSGGRIFSS
ncbi:hypothetical protein KJ657_04980 [Patescibacteria group bacterium]|nr:hypothetical protein [Patescibacteria group bacterium]MBU1016409.1 hypothetical protein [Patescibacteria group bacterium]MBU1685157.1 hypothetical protein [Patescibacteria group bacterium]MBU1938814.1 hypothetical protein [Patescibacteria group bacterium]